MTLDESKQPFDLFSAYFWQNLLSFLVFLLRRMEQSLILVKSNFQHHDNCTNVWWRMQEERRESWGKIRGERHHGSSEVERLILLFNLWRYGGALSLPPAAVVLSFSIHTVWHHSGPSEGGGDGWGWNGTETLAAATRYPGHRRCTK